MSSVPNLANNPYAKALEGLHFKDPVKAFFDFCREREAIRLRREQGEPRENWTKDPVFQQGRFLNVFREDDRVTKALFQFVKPLVDAAKTKPLGMYNFEMDQRVCPISSLNYKMEQRNVSWGIFQHLSRACD